MVVISNIFHVTATYTCTLFVVFALNRSFYPTTSAVPRECFLILYPREIQMLWSDSETEKNHTLKNQGRQFKC